MVIEEKKFEVCTPSWVQTFLALGVLGVSFVALEFSNHLDGFSEFVKCVIAIITILFYLSFLVLYYHFFSKRKDYIRVSVDGLEVNLHQGLFLTHFYGKYSWQHYKVEVTDKKNYRKAKLVISDSNDAVVLNYSLRNSLPYYEITDLAETIGPYTLCCAVNEPIEAVNGNFGVGYMGKVKCVTAYYSFGDWKNFETTGATFRRGPKQKVIFYNESGVLTEAFYYRPDGFKCCTETCDFDDQGYLICKRVKLAGKDAYIDISRKYDADGNKVEEKFYDAEEDSWQTETFFYVNNVLTSSVLVGENLKSTCTCDANGNILTQETNDNDYESRRVYEYNDKGNQIRNTTYSKSGEVDESEDFSYDALDRLVSVKTVGGDTFVSECQYTYDDDNHLVEETLDLQGTIDRSTYVRDEHGNYTEKKLYEDGNLVDVEFFSYEYYD